MKSSLTYSILYQNALQESRKSAYFTLEQGKDLILEHMASMAMADPRAAEQIVTLDMGNIRKNLSYLQGRGTWLELFKMYCKNVMKADPVSVLVVDSLDVLGTMAKLVNTSEMTLTSPIHAPAIGIDDLREGVLASGKAVPDALVPRRPNVRSRGRTSQLPLPSSGLTATKTPRF